MKIRVPRLGKSLQVMRFHEPQENCPYCGLKIQEDAYHEYDEVRRAWRCKTILEPR